MQSLKAFFEHGEPLVYPVRFGVNLNEQCRRVILKLKLGKLKAKSFWRKRWAEILCA